MAMKGNKGEWSEVYTLFKLLGDRELHSGDGQLEKVADLFYPIISILRQESSGEQQYHIQSESIRITNGDKEINISIKDFQEKAKILFESIKASRGSASFALPEIEAFMSSINCDKLKASSKDKSDIRIIIEDIRTGVNPTLGFSIKSQLGSASTLFNASGSTNVLYSITGEKLSAADIEAINSIKPKKGLIKDRISALRNKGADICFQRMVSRTFHNNLVLIDSLMPRILDEMIKLYYIEGISSLKDIVSKLEESNPLAYDMENGHHFYEYKIKRFLTDIALGMTPAKIWNGHYDVTGGYLVVKEDGDILCYHIYNKNDFEDYLLNNVKFDTPSTSRHGFASIENDGDANTFKLNFQLRFKG